MLQLIKCKEKETDYHVRILLAIYFHVNDVINEPTVVYGPMCVYVLCISLEAPFNLNFAKKILPNFQHTKCQRKQRPVLIPPFIDCALLGLILL